MKNSIGNTVTGKLEKMRSVTLLPENSKFKQKKQWIEQNMKSEHKSWIGTHKEEILVNQPIKTRRLMESANQNTPKQQIFLIFFFLRKISMEAHAVHRDWQSYVTPAMDRRSAIS